MDPRRICPPRAAVYAVIMGMSLVMIGNAPTPAEVRIYNEANPAHGLETHELREQWRRGGEDDEVFFGIVDQVLAGPDGHIYVLDTQLMSTFVFTPAGEMEASLGRRGEGPGEVNNLNDMFFLPNGTLGLCQALPGRVVQLDLAGNPAGGFVPGTRDEGDERFCVLMCGRAGGGTVALGTIRLSFLDPANVTQDFSLSSYDTSGREQVRYLEKSHPVDFSAFEFDEQGFDFVWTRWDVLPDGRVCFAPLRDAYEIHICRPDGTLDRVITCEYESFKRDEALRREARESGVAFARNYGREVAKVVIAETEPDILGLQADANGELWVRTSRGDHERPPGVLTTYDVFDAEGYFDRRVSYRAPGDPGKDAIYRLPDGAIVVVRGAVDAVQREEGPPDEGGAPHSDEAALEIICYGMR